METVKVSDYEVDALQLSLLFGEVELMETPFFSVGGRIFC